MTWDWQRLSDVVRRLKLPAGEYAVGRVGYGLSRDRASTADRVELLVTETGRRRLKERGWREHRGGRALRHPHEHDLSARVVELDDVRHEIVEVDEVPVIAVEPDPPAPRQETWRARLSSGITGVVLAVIIAAQAYGWTVFYPTPEPSTIVQHLGFGTTKVEATVDEWTESSSCNGVQPYESSPRIDMTLTWTVDGRETTASFTGCDADVDSPQDIWVTAEGVVASQDSPWADHFWPLLLVGIVPLAFIWTFVERLRGQWRHRGPRPR